VLKVPEWHEILLILVLRKPAETMALEDVGSDGGIKYYRDEDGVRHMPKCALGELILEEHEWVGSPGSLATTGISATSDYRLRPNHF
jgi:hypothetical protein